jgi:signal transduction histidine kinase
VKNIGHIGTTLRYATGAMRLHDKLVIGVLLILLVVMTLGVSVLFRLVTATFQTYEETEAHRELLRARGEVLDEVRVLGATVSLWASDPGITGRTMTWTPSPPPVINDRVAIYSANGSLIRNVSGESLPDLMQALGPENALRPPARSARVEGLVLLDEGVSVICAKGIEASEPAGAEDAPAFLATVRPLTPERLREIAWRSGIRIQVFPAIPAALSPRQASILRQLQIYLPYLLEVSDAETRVGYAALRDFRGQPAALLRTDTDRVVAWSVRVTLQYAAVAILVGALVVLLALLGIVHWTVSRPLRRLTARILEVARTADLSQRVALPQQDEIGILSREFDRLLQQLGDAQRRLVALSFQDGVHQAGAKALHDIGNIVMPIMMALELLPEAVRHLNNNVLLNAAAEWKSETDPERRLALTKKVEGELEQMRHAVEDVRNLAADAARGACRVEEVLREVQSISRPAIPDEPVAPRDLVTTAIAMLSSEARSDVVIELDPSLAVLPPVSIPAHRIYPVFHAVLLNAAEAIHHQAKPGRIRVDGESDDKTVSVRISDSGGGVTPDAARCLFDRGFTTKGRQKSAFDLHWCANTMRSADGAIRLDPAAKNGEMVFVVILPRK